MTLACREGVETNTRRCGGNPGGNFTFVLANTYANALILRNGDVAEWLKAAVC